MQGYPYGLGIINAQSDMCSFVFSDNRQNECNYNFVSLYTSMVYHLLQSTGCTCYTVHMCVDIYSCSHTYLCMIYLSCLTFLPIINKFLGGKVLLLKNNLSMAFWKKPCRQINPHKLFSLTQDLLY